MILKKLRLVEFKNYTDSTFSIENQRVALVGKNGCGKTNFLDALHHLGLVRSVFHKQDAFQIAHGSDFYRLDAELEELGQNHRLELVYQREEKKKLLWNKSKLERMTDHVGRIPLVLILPDEPFHMHESSEWRRNFFDNTLSQSFPEYLQHLAEYKKAVARRNASLVYFNQRQHIDFALLEALDHQLIIHSGPIHDFRNHHLPGLSDTLQTAYREISDEAEAVDLTRKSDLDSAPMEELLKKNQRQDIEAQRSTVGLHKDDYLFQMNGHPLKKVGSQGQQKSFLLALKMAQYGFIRTHSGKKPWLLLDDIFDKLDDDRIGRLLEIINGPEMGQVFLTDARPDRSKDLIHRRGLSFQVIEI